MMIVRPARTTDLPALEHMAAASAAGVTGLTPHREYLFERIQQSIAALDSDVAWQSEESYTFMLEVDGQVVGTAGLIASAGFTQPFYSYRNETLIHASAALGVTNKIHALTLCNDLTGVTQLCGFYLDPAFLDSAAADMLSRARLLFIASHPQRLSERLFDERQGHTDAEGRYPFWEAIGKPFFKMEVEEVDRRIALGNKTFIAELMPTYPIYVPLLPDAAQQAMGQIHPDAEVPFAILMDEGFEADDYIDAIDGAPTLTAKTHWVRSIMHSRIAQLHIIDNRPAGTETYLICNQRTSQFRAVLADVLWHGDEVWVSPDTAQALACEPGDSVRLTPFTPVVGQGEQA